MSSLDNKIRKLANKSKTRTTKNIVKAYTNKNLGKPGPNIKAKIKKIKGDKSWN